MNILHITSRVPYPLVDGARIVMHQLLVAMKRSGHAVTLVAIDEEGVNAEPLHGLADVHVVRIQPQSRIIGALGTMFDERPYSQARRDAREAYSLIDRLVRSRHFDLVIADQAHVAQYGWYVKEKYEIPYILRSHNIEHEIYRRHVSTIRNPLLRRYVRLQMERWRRFETLQHQRADAAIAITQRDADQLAAIAPGVPVTCIPASVDLASFPFHDPMGRDDCSVVLIGNMSWPPNRNSLLWFVHDILPLLRREVPEVVVHVVGEGVPRAELPQACDTFRIHGRVDSISPFYETTTVGLIPLNVGGGMRVKMVEMMSSGLPVVATSLGAEGNMAVPDVHYLRGDSPAEFAASLAGLLRSKERQRELAIAARAFVEATYSLDHISVRLEALLKELYLGRVHA